MAKATTNKMSPKTEHVTSLALKAKRSRDMAATEHVTALLHRHQFIASLIDFTSPASPAINKTSTKPTGLDKFNPFDSVFLFSAPEQTIALMAKLCIKIGARTTILTMPAELRLRIYGLAIEDHWGQHKDNYPLDSSASRMWDLTFREPLEPPVLRACKLFREEAAGEYKNFLQGACDSRKKHIERWKEIDAQRRLELSRKDRADDPERAWLEFLVGTTDYSYLSTFTHDGRKAVNAEAELKRLRMLEQQASKKKQRRTRRKVTKRNQ